MPAKAIPVIIAAVVATGVVIYQNREQILEIVEIGREKLATQLHKFADTLAGHRVREDAYGGRSEYYNAEAQEEEERQRRQAETEDFLRPRPPVSRASGFAQADGGLRHRGPVDQYGVSPHQSIISTGPNTIPLQHLHRPPPSDTETPGPPLPPRPQSIPPLQVPSESGYGSERTILATPALGPQPSPLAQVVPPRQQHGPTVPNQEFVMPFAATATAGAVVAATTVAAVAVASSSPSIPPQSPPPFSIHSTPEDDEEEQEATPNPFESSTQYRAIHEWATNASQNIPASPIAVSEAGSAPEEVQDIGDGVSEFDSASEGDFSEVGSWTEVGSETSENDY
ncbi:hypothetical protein DFH27DRAFT_528769 [Peziza echinospora]|nr:hypothetical protein DFH27DRAFT_528769 [Peziza echinospora]